MKNMEFLNHSIIAHRGIYNNITIMENSLESIMYAVKNNLAIEIDVRVTKDNYLIVFHDEDGSRLLKLKDKINTLTKDEIDYISNYHIPTLDEVLNLVNGKIPILIDIKDDNKIVRKKVCELLKEYKGKVLIQSFIYDAVMFYKKNNYISGLLISGKRNKDYLNKDKKLDFLSIKYNIIDKNKIKLLKENYYLIGWTIDSRSDAEEYIKLYNNLIIDDIEEVFK